ncbi:MAG TPA: phosphotransferase [Candidatus Eisenbacteria bacterium]|nr:phosphotransferase [Candidatus Eisenbacteria bacterium]
MSRELEEIAALLSSSAPQLLGEPIEERARSEDKTVWSVGGCVVRRANSAPVRDLFRREHRLLHHVRGRVSLGVPTPLFITATGEFDILEKAPGEPVAFEWWASLDAVSQEGIASHFGRFLAEFHELFPLETASAMGFERSFWPPSASWIETRLRGRLDSPERRSLLEDLLRVAPWLHEEASLRFCSTTTSAITMRASVRMGSRSSAPSTSPTRASEIPTAISGTRSPASRSPRP